MACRVSSCLGRAEAVQRTSAGRWGCAIGQQGFHEDSGQRRLGQGQERARAVGSGLGPGSWPGPGLCSRRSDVNGCCDFWKPENPRGSQACPGLCCWPSDSFVPSVRSGPAWRGWHFPSGGLRPSLSGGALGPGRGRGVRGPSAGPGGRQAVPARGTPCPPAPRAGPPCSRLPWQAPAARSLPWPELLLPRT